MSSPAYCVCSCSDAWCLSRKKRYGPATTGFIFLPQICSQFDFKRAEPRSGQSQIPGKTARFVRLRAYIIKLPSHTLTYMLCVC